MPKWPTQAEVPKFYGGVGKNQVMITTPYPLYLAWDKHVKVERFSCHKLVKDSLRTVLENVMEYYGKTEISRLGLDQFGGCLNVRKMRGGNSWSMHAWGIAIDFDPNRNQLRWDKTKAEFAKDVYIPWWEIWEKEGWVSLGRARDYDWMHVQAARL